MENYRPIKIEIKEAKKYETVLQELFYLFPEEDIYFEVNNNEIIIYLRELDFLHFKNSIHALIQKSDKNTSNLLT